MPHFKAFCMMNLQYDIKNLSLTHCAFIMNFMENSYFVLQIHHAKSFK